MDIRKPVPVYYDIIWKLEVMQVLQHLILWNECGERCSSTLTGWGKIPYARSVWDHERMA